jgi:hypothetical protein
MRHESWTMREGTTGGNSALHLSWTPGQRAARSCGFLRPPIPELISNPMVLPTKSGPRRPALRARSPTALVLNGDYPADLGAPRPSRRVEETEGDLGRWRWTRSLSACTFIGWEGRAVGRSEFTVLCWAARLGLGCWTRRLARAILRPEAQSRPG